MASDRPGSDSTSAASHPRSLPISPPLPTWSETASLVRRALERFTVSRLAPLLLGIVMIGALVLRGYGLHWGLPGRTDLNPDEETVLEIIAQMGWENLDPGRYFYGAFFYQACLVIRGLLQSVWPSIGDTVIVLAYRSVSVLFGTATLAVLYVLLRRIAGPGPAPLLGAVMLALMPLHVWDSHFAVTDVTLTFWMTATVTAAVVAYHRPSWGRFAFASALAGAATGTKFNGAFAAVAIALAALAAWWERRLRFRQLVAWGALGVAVALLALFVASPYMFLQWDASWRAFMREFNRVGMTHYSGLGAPGWQYRPYVYQLGAAFPFSFGVALYGALLAGLVYCAARWRRVLLIPLGYAALYLVVVGRWQYVPIRYYLPVEPVLLIAPALALAAGLTAPSRRLRWGTAAALIVVLGYTLAFTVSTTARFADDTRLQAERWLRPLAEDGSTILMVGARWYLPDSKGPGVSQLLRYGAMPREVAHRRPHYVVLTSLHYLRSYRRQDGNVALWNTVRRGELPYRRVRRFRAEYLNWRLYTKLDPLFEGYFVSPTIEVYRRVE
jgi:hypothetical protein